MRAARPVEVQGAVCPACQAPDAGRKFCHLCGHPLRAEAKPVLEQLGELAVLPAGVTPPREGLPLVHPRAGTGQVHVVGVHGGAGERTIAAALEGLAVAAGHGWPYLDAPENALPARFPVVLVCRSNMGGLRAAQLAIRQYVSGAVSGSARLLGLVVIQDAPGKLPKPLREMQRHVLGALAASGLPNNLWEIPYIESLRLGVPIDHQHLDAKLFALRHFIQTASQKE